jgi:NADH-quinone oxidoreductase subunit N
MYPIIILSVLGIVTLYLGFSKSRSILLPSVLLFLLVALCSNFIDWKDSPLLYFQEMMIVNHLTLSFNTILLVAAFMVIALTGGFQDNEEAQPAEYYAIMLFSLVGAMMMVGYNHMIMLFIGVEILSIAMYILAGSDKRNVRSNEASLKYFLMGAFASGIMLFGIALLYAGSGTLSLSGLTGFASTAAQQPLSYIYYPGLLLLLIGLLFKVSAAPFHFWTPDVYEGSPTIFTTFMSTIVKVAGFAAIFRLLYTSQSSTYDYWWITLVGITILTLLIGNVTAVYQESFKRMLAYSSISHAGYLLITLTALTAKTETAILFYSISYVLATIVAFGVLMLVEKERAIEGRLNTSYEAFNGLAKNNPLLAFMLTVSLLSLAGIPLTAGFWGKFLVFSSAVERGLTWLLVFAAVMSTVGIYYYFRAIIAAYVKEGTTPAIRIAPFYKIVLMIATLLTILLGLVPSLVENLF